MAFLFDRKERHYLFADTNAIVPVTLLRQWIDTAAAFAEVEFRTVTERFIRGEIDFDQWRLALVELTRDEHRAVGMIAFGGLAQMTAGSWSALADEIRFQQGKLAELFLRVGTGQKPLDGNLVANAGLYALAGWQVHENLVRVREIITNDIAKERRVDVGDAWTCEDCREQAAQGWSNPGTLKRIGDTSCTARCRCFFVYQRTVTEARSGVNVPPIVVPNASANMPHSTGYNINVTGGGTAIAHPQPAAPPSYREG
jgi:hypothetical protein